MKGHFGILGGASTVSICSFDEKAQKALISIEPESKMKQLQCALFFISSYQGVRCNVSTEPNF